MTATSIFGPNLTEARCYNSIRVFTTDLPFDAEIIQKVGEIIRRHKMEKDFGALSLHRHFDIPQNSISVKSALTNDIDVIRFCQVSEILPDEIRGSSFKLSANGQFEPFEYTTHGAEAEFPKPFADDMAEFILQNHLDDVLGLFRRNEREDGVELNLIAQKIGVKVPANEIPKDMLLQASATAWTFSDQEKDVGGYKCSHSTSTDADGTRDKDHLFIIQAVLRKRGVTIPDLILP
jgi:hypothetical protein